MLFAFSWPRIVIADAALAITTCTVQAQWHAPSPYELNQDWQANRNRQFFDQYNTFVGVARDQGAPVAHECTDAYCQDSTKIILNGGPIWLYDTIYKDGTETHKFCGLAEDGSRFCELWNGDLVVTKEAILPPPLSMDDALKLGRRAPKH
jgi:hypothetical protein